MCHVLAISHSDSADEIDAIPEDRVTAIIHNLRLDHPNEEERSIGHAYPLSDITEILDHSRESICFLVTDLTLGYHQIQSD